MDGVEVQRETREGSRLSQPGLLGGSAGRQRGLTVSGAEPILPPTENLDRKTVSHSCEKAWLVGSEGPG